MGGGDLILLKESAEHANVLVRCTKKDLSKVDIRIITTTKFQQIMVGNSRCFVKKIQRVEDMQYSKCNLVGQVAMWICTGRRGKSSASEQPHFSEESGTKGFTSNKNENIDYQNA